MLRTPLFAALGLRAFTRGGYERATRRADWPSARMDDDSALLGRHCVVTGANAGIGLEIALGLARHGATVHLVCRRATAGEAAAERVRAAGGGRAPVHLWSCDLSSLASIRAFAEAFLAAGHPAHVLVNNAGVLLDGAPASADGYEVSSAASLVGQSKQKTS
jgi:dehydrogenase/reductase SDR family protein 12